MCVVSAVLNHGMQIPQLDHDWWSKPVPTPRPVPQFPNIFFPNGVVPDGVTYPMQVKTPVVASPDKDTIVKEFLKLVKQAVALDEAAQQKDCEDPEKVKFLQKLLTRFETIDQELLDLKKEVRILLKLDENI